MLPAESGSPLAEDFRRAVLEFLVNDDALAGGFAAHYEVTVPAKDAEGREKLPGYMPRASALGRVTAPGRSRPSVVPRFFQLNSK